jgi:hypothetical protein
MVHKDWKAPILTSCLSYANVFAGKKEFVIFPWCTMQDKCLRALTNYYRQSQKPEHILLIPLPKAKV